MAKKKSAGLELAEKQVADSEKALQKARSSSSYLRPLHVREAQQLRAARRSEGKPQSVERQLTDGRHLPRLHRMRTRHLVLHVQ